MPTNLYGPGDNYHPTNSHVLPALIRRFHEAAEANAPSVTCWGTGTPLREFLHVDDLGEACVFALEHWSPAPGELTYWNVASATGYQGTIEWATNKPDGTPKKQLDVSRLAALGWHARIPLAEGLTSTVALFREELAQQLVRL